jgi:hypothetical protein
MRLSPLIYLPTALITLISALFELLLIDRLLRIDRHRFTVKCKLRVVPSFLEPERGVASAVGDGGWRAVVEESLKEM